MKLFEDIIFKRNLSRKKGDLASVLLLSTLMSEIQRNAKGKEPTEEESSNTIRKVLKGVNETLSLMKGVDEVPLSSGDVRAVLLKEKEILEGYLPQQLSALELEEVVNQAIIDVQAAHKNEMGKVMQELNRTHKGFFDGKIASQMVRGKLR